jgi:hypothetical protein
LNDAPRDFCVLNKRAEENERLTICKQLKWFWFYPQIYADFLGGKHIFKVRPKKHRGVRNASVKLGDSFLQRKTRMDTKKFHGEHNTFAHKKPLP